MGAAIARGDQIIVEGRERAKELLDQSAHAEGAPIRIALLIICGPALFTRNLVSEWTWR